MGPWAVVDGEHHLEDQLEVLASEIVRQEIMCIESIVQLQDGEMALAESGGGAYSHFGHGRFIM